MKKSIFIIIMAFSVMFLTVIPSNALRCKCGLVSIGDRTFMVLKRCGDPIYKEIIRSGSALSKDSNVTIGHKGSDVTIKRKGPVVIIKHKGSDVIIKRRGSSGIINAPKLENWVYGPMGGMYHYLLFKDGKLFKIESFRR